MNEADKKRVDDFMAEYKALVDKHKVDFANYPVYMPDGSGGFKTVLQSTPVDITKLSVKSPFISQ